MFGLSTATVIILMPFTLVKLVGKEALDNGIGLTEFGYGLMVMAGKVNQAHSIISAFESIFFPGPPLFGLLVESFEVFDYAFYCGSSLFSIGAICNYLCKYYVENVTYNQIE